MIQFIICDSFLIIILVTILMSDVQCGFQNSNKNDLSIAVNLARLKKY